MHDREGGGGGGSKTSELSLALALNISSVQRTSKIYTNHDLSYIWLVSFHI